MPRRACAAQWRATHLVVAPDEARRVLAQRCGLRRGRGGLALGRLGAAPQQLVVLGGQHKVAEQAADERRGLGAERLDVVERAQLRAQRAQRGLARGLHPTDLSGIENGGSWFRSSRIRKGG